MKDRIYIIHDINTKRDPKIILLTQKYGLEGYGVFWALLEYMREDESIKLSIVSGNAFAYELHIDEEKLAKIVDFCVEVGLFQRDENSFWSPRLLRDVEWMREKKDKSRRAAMIRWGAKVSDKNADALRTHTKSDADALPNKIKENKIEDIKLKEDDGLNRVIDYYHELVKWKFNTDASWGRKNYGTLSSLLEKRDVDDISRQLKWWFTQDKKELERMGFDFSTIFSVYSTNKYKLYVATK